MDLLGSFPEVHKIDHTVAKEWSEVEPYKDSVYLPFFEKFKFEKSYLEERWLVLEKFFKTAIPTIVLLHKAKISLDGGDEPVGFLTVQNDEQNTLLYTSPCLLKPEEINTVYKEVVEDVFPKTEDAYCMVNASNAGLKQLVKSLGWKEVETSPISPNKEFVGDTPITFFEYVLKNN